MTVYKNCLMTGFDAEDTFETECEVNITDEKITLSYFHEEIQGPINYVGEALGDGHYRLECPKVKGEASLHRFPNGKFLEGYWLEDGYEGMWRIELKD
jgi:hypothetical protein